MDSPVAQPFSQDLLHMAWEHQLQQFSQLVHQDKQNFPPQQMHCERSILCKYIEGAKIFGKQKLNDLKEKNSNQISAPTPCCGNASSTVINLLVFLTEVLIVDLSSGLMERKFITCT